MTVGYSIVLCYNTGIKVNLAKLTFIMFCMLSILQMRLYTYILSRCLKTVKEHSSLH